MAKIENPVARKEYKCSKCGSVINKGDHYFKGSPYMQKPIIRCSKCGLRRWELSSSDYIQTVGHVVECWKEDYEVGEDTAQEIADELETLQDECQDRLDNMPEGLQEGDAGQLLQERIDQLSDVVSELEGIDDFDSFKEDASYDVDQEEDESDEEYDERVLEQAKSNLSDAIDDALSQLDY